MMLAVNLALSEFIGVAPSWQGVGIAVGRKARTDWMRPRDFS